MEELRGFLRGLENEGVEFWTDQRIATGELWDEEIKRKIAESEIALALVSQAFLDSPYCTRIEIGTFIVQRTHIFPIILSPCEWQRHDWLKSRQFLPGGDKTIEEHYTESGPRRRLFLKLRQDLRKQIEKRRSALAASPNPFDQILAIRESGRFIGRNAELTRLRNLLQGGSVALLGEPKIGKSSLLWRLIESWQGEILGPFDFQEIEDQDDFYNCLAEKLGILESGWRPIREKLKQRRTLLVLDELDAAPERGLKGECLGQFRAICNHNLDFKMVAASRNPLKAVFPDSGRGSPPFNFLQPLTLGEMRENEARELLRHPWMPAALSFDSATVDAILQLAKFHPFKLQRAAFHCYHALTDPTYDWQSDWRQDMEHML